MKALLQTGSSLSACDHAQAGGQVPVPPEKRFLINNYAVCVSWGLLVFTSLALGDPAQKNMQIYLLIGQSNMAGRAPITQAESTPIERCFLLDGENEWVPAQSPLNIYSSIRKGPNMQRLGPGDSFARTMTAGTPSVPLGLVVNAQGGTGIDQWGKGTKFYNEALRRTQEAIVQGGELAGILWHQGESDNQNPDGYLEKLAQLVKDLRADLADSDLPFVAGQIKDAAAINNQIARLPELVHNTAYASSEGLTTYDRWHFDTNSINLLGVRYAEAMRTLQQENVQTY